MSTTFKLRHKLKIGQMDGSELHRIKVFINNTEVAFASRPALPGKTLVQVATALADSLLEQLTLVKPILPTRINLFKACLRLITDKDPEHSRIKLEV